jgi:hypothetical protein
MSTPRKRAHRGEIIGKVLTLQDAIRETVHNTAGVERKVLAELASIRYHDLIECGSDGGQRRLRFSEAVAVINATHAITGERNYLMADVFNRLIGYGVPVVGADPSRTDIEVATTSVRECADVQGAFVDAIADRVITDEELSTFEREADEAIRAIEVARQHLRLRAGER